MTHFNLAANKTQGQRRTLASFFPHLFLRSVVLKEQREHMGPALKGIPPSQPTNGCRRMGRGLERLWVYLSSREQAIKRAYHRWWEPCCQCGWISLYRDTRARAVIIQLGSSFSIFAVFNPLSPEAFCQAWGFLSSFFFGWWWWWYRCLRSGVPYLPVHKRE